MSVIRDRGQLESILEDEASVSLKDIIKEYLDDIEVRVLEIERILNVDELDESCIREANDLLKELARDLY
jgi:hypothetical protein